MEALLTLVLAVQEVQDGTYTNEKYKIRLTAPKGWTVEKGEDDTLCDFGCEDPEVGGQLDFDEDAAKLSVEEKAGFIEAGFKQLEGASNFKRIRDEKLKKTPGDWLAREYTMTYEGVDLRYSVVFVKRDQTHFMLMAWCSQGDWEKCKDAVAKLIEGLAFTDAKPVTAKGFRYNAFDSWNGFAPGAWSEYDLVDGGGTTKIRLTLDRTEETTAYVRRNIGGKEDVENFSKTGRGFFLTPESDCPACGKKVETHDDKGSWGEGSVKVGNRELPCAVYTPPKKDCRGNALATQEVWFSSDVPGHIVKFTEGKMTLTLVGFETKGGGKPAEKTEKKETGSGEFTFDPFEAWSSFEVGSWVETKITSDFGMKAENLQKTVLKSKDHDRVVVEIKMQYANYEQEFRRTGTSAGPAECSQCKAKHKEPQIKTSKAELKVADRAVPCVVVETISYDCKQAAITYKMWCSKEVPGWTVRAELDLPSGKSVTECLKFEGKPASGGGGDKKGESAQDTSFEEKLLATLPEGVGTSVEIYPVFSPAGRSASYIMKRGGREYAVIGGQRSEPYDGVNYLTYSPDGSSIAYAAKRDGKTFLIRDGKSIGEFKNVERIKFSPDGKTLAFEAYRDSKGFVVVGDKEGEAFNVVGGLSWSPDGKSVAYLGWRNNSYYIVAGESKYGPFADVGHPVWSPDGKNVAFGCQDDFGSWEVRCGEERHGPYQRVLGIVFSPDGKSLAYGADDGTGRFVVVNGKAGPKYDHVEWPAFSPDGKVVAYPASTSRGIRLFMVVGDKKGAEFRTMGTARFSPDGKSVAYWAKDEDKNFVIVAGNRVSDPFDSVSNPQFSPDGKKVAFGAQKGRELWWKVLEFR